jgi:transposase
VNTRPNAAYSLDLRQRVLRAWDSGLDVYSVAAKYEVSRAWFHRLVQRRHETGSIEAHQQRKFRHRVLSDQQDQRLIALMYRRRGG